MASNHWLAGADELTVDSRYLHLGMACAQIAVPLDHAWQNGAISRRTYRPPRPLRAARKQRITNPLR